MGPLKSHPQVPKISRSRISFALGGPSSGARCALISRRLASTWHRWAFLSVTNVSPFRFFKGVMFHLEGGVVFSCLGMCGSSWAATICFDGLGRGARGSLQPSPNQPQSGCMTMALGCLRFGGKPRGKPFGHMLSFVSMNARFVSSRAEMQE